MRKIPTIFIRNPGNMKELLNEINSVCQWVFDGEGIALRKYDGTCVAIMDGKYYKRREIKQGQKVPIDFIEIEYDEKTNKCVGWAHVDDNDPADKYHREAYDKKIPDGTYELCGPKINGNPEKLKKHTLIAHSFAEKFNDCPRDMNGLKTWFVSRDIEGIVFQHPDGRRAKIKQRDFNMKRSGI